MIVDQVQKLWTDFLGFLTGIVVPDWGGLVVLLPIFLVIGVVGPIVTLIALAWMRYGLARPRLRADFTEARRPAPLDVEGNPVYPAGEPYSPRERMIYEPGATRSAGGDTLVLACPKCGLVRGAAIDMCGNCGLSFKLQPPTRVLRPADPPPGGAAAA